MNTVTVEFTQDELNTLSALLDVAVKAGGIQAARPALAIIGKIEQAIADKNAEQVTAS